MSAKPVLVVGATGLAGAKICDLLAGQGRPVRGLVRSTSDPEKTAALEKNGVELVVGDLKDHASLDKACAGVDAIVSTASSTLSRQEGDTIESVDRGGQIALVDTAAAAGVGRFVFVSFRDSPSNPFSLTQAKRAVESHLARSRMAYSVLQASYFMEVWLGPALGFDYAAGKVRVYGDGSNTLSWVSFQDVAKLAAVAVDHAAASNATLEIGGPEPLSPLEVVKTFEDVTGRKFIVEHVPVADLEAQKRGAPDPLEESFARLMLNYAAGDPMPEARGTADTLGVQLTSVRDYAKAVTAG